MVFPLPDDTAGPIWGPSRYQTIPRDLFWGFRYQTIPRDLFWGIPAFPLPDDTAGPILEPPQYQTIPRALLWGLPDTRRYRGPTAGPILPPKASEGLQRFVHRYQDRRRTLPSSPRELQPSGPRFWQSLNGVWGRIFWVPFWAKDETELKRS